MSADPDFVHLRVHSSYSLSEGAILVKELPQLCKMHGMPAVAVTDTDNLFGALEFSQAAAGAGVQPIIGCQISLARPEDAEAARLGVARVVGPDDTDSIVLLVQNETGYLNLLKLMSRAYLGTEGAEAPHVSYESLEAHATGLICLTGGVDGPVGRLLLDGKDEQAEAALARLAGFFPGRLYVEVQRHGMPAEDATEDRLVDLAYRRELPLVATNDAYFADAEMYEAHDALLCIAERTYVNQEDRRRVTPEHRFKSGAEMRALFADLPEAVENTLTIARRCHFFPETVKPILPAFPTREGRSESEELRAQAEAGLAHRLETQVFTEDMDEHARERERHRYAARLDYELDVIVQMGFPGYFLIVADFIQWAKAKGIPVGPGRGSGAGSVVAWSLTITDLDPIRLNLLFERFLNPERVSMPDFDIDFCQERRDEVIHYVQGKYGHEKVAQIITFGKLQARAALRDVGRVLQLPFPVVDRLCKLVPNNPANPVTLAQAIEGEPQLQIAREEDEGVARMIGIALKLEGLYRNASTHAAGVVIGDRALDELVPLYRDRHADMPVTQFNMKWVEQAGLVKFDFLGLKTLTVLARARDLLAERGVTIDFPTIPLDDPATYEMLGRGDTVGVFQLESSGMRDVLRRLRADRFEDIVAVVALYRPGPMDNIPSYIRRKHNEEKADYLHPHLEGILKETFGIMIYQEQVMQAAQELAGYTLGSADLLRRAMGKKIKSEMDAQRQHFTEGAVARGVDERKASAIFDQIAKFAGYGFNKSHAAAYALVAYHTAYLKANHPVEFLAASMTYDMSNTDKLNIFRQELQRMGIPLLPPDINRSRPDFGVEESEDGTPAIRYALAAIKNVGGQAMQALVQEREANGEFRDLSDIANRIDMRQINKRQIEMLACAGAFDSLVQNRHQVFRAAETLMRHASAAASERESEQTSLFGEDGGGSAPRISLPPVDDWPAMERLRHEFDAIGFYLSAHPLDEYGKSLERLRVVNYADLPRIVKVEPGRKKLAGIVVEKQERTSKSGNRFAFVRFSDTSGVYEAVLFSEILAKSRELLDSGQPLLLTCDAKVEGEDIKLLAVDVEPLDDAAQHAAAGMKVYLGDRQPLETLRSVLARDQKGRGKVSLVINLSDGQEVEMELPGGYRLSPNVRQAIKAISGITVQDL
ncbi:MAG: DNA polymerase III subunit alpha [Rhodovibrionaceae bacterium]|nr:DNA polymerase III subunit alpha [Rhodovibrionaceae bacterium]